MGARVRAYDPAAMESAKMLLGNVTFCGSAYACADNADALVVATEWQQFCQLDLQRLRPIMACPVIVDLRNVFDPQDMMKHGFTYTGIGRPARIPASQSRSDSLRHFNGPASLLTETIRRTAVSLGDVDSSPLPNLRN